MPDAFSEPAAWHLALDASTYGGTVAVLRGREVVVEREVAMRGEREERLMPAVVDALAAAGVTPAMLAGIVCGAGPGSFTSLRIAASIAKGIAHAVARPLYAAPSLALLVTGGRACAPGAFLATLDALRGESYAAIVTIDASDGEVTGYDDLGLVPTASLDDVARARDVRRVAATEVPRARGVRMLGRLLAESGPVDLDAWEPAYGRKAEAQVKWEAAHGRELRVDAGTSS